MSDQLARVSPAPTATRPRLRLALLLLALGLVPLPFLLPNPWTSQDQAQVPADNRPTVRTAVATRGDMPILLQGLGVVTPFSTVTVRPRIGGELQSVSFREGQMVRQGDDLAQIDPRPYEAIVGAIEGDLMRDQALLEQAQVDLARYRPLAERDDISKQKYDAQQSLVRQYQGTLIADRARLAGAQVNLAYCHITAPISGRVGLRLVDPGNDVKADDPTGLVVIAALQPISVIFPLPEDDLPKVMRRLAAGVDLPVDIYDRAGRTLIESGTLFSVDNQVDVATGTARLRARVANAANVLFPNQFVTARLRVDTLHDAVVVPEAAIQEGTDGHYVWLVRTHGRVTVRRVATGPVAGGRIAVLDGLKPGARVVTDGADRLREGARVVLSETAGGS
jgi:multidrug efflux system membrane fusion protein